MVPLRHDLFHFVREAHRISQRLERHAYRAIEETERARRAEREAISPKRRRGKPLKVTFPRAQSEADCERAIPGKQQQNQRCKKQQSKILIFSPWSQ